MFIVDLKTKQLWTVRENFDKASTQRKVGALTIPLETRKRTEVGNLEYGIDNVIGALDEFRELLPGEELLAIAWEPEKPSSFKGLFTVVDGAIAEITIIGLRNKSADDDAKARSNEVEAAGWRDLDDLLQAPDLRSGVRELLKLVKEKGWIDSTIEAMLVDPSKTVVMNDHISLAVDRERLRDMDVVRDAGGFDPK